MPKIESGDEMSNEELAIELLKDKALYESIERSILCLMVKRHLANYKYGPLITLFNQPETINYIKGQDPSFFTAWVLSINRFLSEKISTDTQEILFWKAPELKIYIDTL